MVRMAGDSSNQSDKSDKSDPSDQSDKSDPSDKDVAVLVLHDVSDGAEEGGKAVGLG